LLPSPDHATRWFWRKRKYLLRDMRPHRLVADLAAKLHREYRFDAFFGREECPLLADSPSLGPSFVDLCDVGSQQAKSGFDPVERLRLAAFRRKLSRFQRVFVTKLSDAARIGLPSVRVLPCISTQRDFTVAWDSTGNGNRILFVGGSWRPNQEGLMRFVQRSLPIIRQLVPSATLRVVGSHDEKFLSALREHEGVELAGFVPDVGAEYRQADICVCPIWSGWGSNVKLAEYASFDRAVVATTFSASGFEGILEPGRDLLVADTDEGLAAHCVELLKNERLRCELGQNAGRTAEASLSQPAIDRIIGDAIGPTLAG
jgi:glycosyltransferase involved in cell wall biosynthesis